MSYEFQVSMPAWEDVLFLAVLDIPGPWTLLLEQSGSLSWAVCRVVLDFFFFPHLFIKINGKLVV